MNAKPEIKGWCPGALTPMQSGDGLVVRIRPFNGRLTSAQATGLAQLSAIHGNGLLDLSSRANLQIRGVSEQSYPPLIEALDALHLLDQTPQAEARRNILLTPFWSKDDTTDRLAIAFTEVLAAANAPDLPKKFGFAIDTGPTPVLQTASADIRLERSEDGTLLIAADTAPTARAITEETAVDEALSLARHFLTTRTSENRMRALLQRTETLPPGHTVARPKQSDTPKPGPTPQGTLIGLALGQITADTLAALAEQGPLRLTPWRMLLVEGATHLPTLNGLITNPSNPLLRINACTGAPACSQALIETRALARTLAPRLKPMQTLHVSGCAKGCAHPRPADLTVTGTPQGLALIRQGRASDTPAASGLTPTDLQKAL